MSAKQTCLLAIDQGTTSSRAVAFSEQGRAIASAQQEFQQIYPHPGWVEHDPEVIWATVLTVTRKALERAGEAGYAPAAIGITNQRETAVIWDRANGRPIANAIVWQDRRTADTTRRLATQGHGEMVAARAGLVLDPYFSATKIAWLLDNTPGARERAARGELAFGTIDSFLIWRLTGGRVHETDATNASRTSLYNIDEGRWDAELCALFDVPESLLPSVRDCVADFGATDSSLFGMEIPIRGVAGDQQAATIGQACFAPGEMKSTYGTGAFMLLNTGAQRLQSQSRLLATIAYQLNGEVTYALEGSILSAGATVQWLRDGLGLIARAGEIEALAADAAAESEVYLVPAFTGLGAPHWDPDARAAIIGLTRDAGRAEIAQAALDSTAYQTWELLECAAADGAEAMRLKVDGGMTANDRLLQRLSDICDIEVVRPADVETTAWGAAFLAGLGAGVYSGLEDGAALWRADRTFAPQMGEAERARLRQGWRRAVARVASGEQ